MKWPTVLAAGLAALVLMPSAATPDSLPALGVVAKAGAVNGALQTYTARIAFDIDLHAFLEIHPTLHATYYFKRPDKAKLDFDTIPAMAQQFQHIYASLATPDTWPQLYNVSFAKTPVAGQPYLLKLVPKKDGNVDRVFVTIDSTSYGIERSEWRYKNGSWIIMQQTLGAVSGFLLPQGQIGDFSLPSYKAHVIATYSDYRLNVPIPDSVFKQ